MSAVLGRAAGLTATRGTRGDPGSLHLTRHEHLRTICTYHEYFVFVFVFSTGLVRLYIAGLPLRSCRTIGAPSVQGSTHCAFFRFWQ